MFQTERQEQNDRIATAVDVSMKDDAGHTAHYYATTKHAAKFNPEIVARLLTYGKRVSVWAWAPPTLSLSLSLSPPSTHTHKHTALIWFVGEVDWGTRNSFIWFQCMLTCTNCNDVTITPPRSTFRHAGVIRIRINQIKSSRVKSSPVFLTVVPVLSSPCCRRQRFPEWHD